MFSFQNALLEDVRALELAINTTVLTTTQVVDSIEELVTNITGPVLIRVLDNVRFLGRSHTFSPSSSLLPPPHTHTHSLSFSLSLSQLLSPMHVVLS